MAEEEITGFLTSENYPAAISYYEQKITENPEEITNYWHLGLAYLLNGNEEEATATWLIPFVQLQPENTDFLNESLVEVLEAEAKRQEEISQQHTALIIREKIAEFAPYNLENTLRLLLLKFSLNQFYISLLEEYKLAEVVREKFEGNHRGLLFKLLDRILECPHIKTLEFLEKIKPLVEGYKEVVDLIMSKVDLMAEDKGYVVYGAKLLELLLSFPIQNNDDKLWKLHRIFRYYIRACRHEDAKRIALKYEKHSKTRGEKLLASQMLVYNQIHGGDWLSISPYVERYKQRLKEFIEEDEPLEKDYLKTWLIATVDSLYWLQDKPRENRFLINGIAKRFELENRSRFSYPVYFYKPKNRQKKLKIGYIGHTLRSHSVGLLSRWLISHHDRENFSIYVYLVCQPEDYITQTFFINRVDKTYSGGRNVNEYITEIEKDEVDILVDLDSLTHNITAIVMSLKPAPIQVSWLGMDSSGIPSLDYFIADPYVLPDSAQEYYREKIWRLPHVYIAVDGFEIDIPTLKRQHLGIEEEAVVYLNVQNSFKRNPHIIRLQMQILKAVANSYLLIKGFGDEKATKDLFATIATEEGVNPDRIKFLPPTPTEAIHRANLKIADVVLDTYPYNGATTTLETLWQEIPIVTRVGEQFAARNSYTFMMNVGVREGIAFTDEEYVEWGIKLGKDENLRNKVSWQLRQAKHTSPLWNARQFARDMENAYRQMWEIYTGNC
ncbi:MAG: O-linked N-acetylglucosamine transferase, SPINDLY family protein [Geminocystis sp.]|nr:O-linked N-acetylglucosamine transferase, SPINDLY family protein [Geminocystis sp.]